MKGLPPSAIVLLVPLAGCVSVPGKHGNPCPMYQALSQEPGNVAISVTLDGESQSFRGDQFRYDLRSSEGAACTDSWAPVVGGQVSLHLMSPHTFAEHQVLPLPDRPPVERPADDATPDAGASLR